MMALVFPLVLALLGLLQVITGLPCRRLDQMWIGLEDFEQRVIVYGLLFGIPILTIWIAYDHC